MSMIDRSQVLLKLGNEMLAGSSKSTKKAAVSGIGFEMGFLDLTRIFVAGGLLGF